MAYNIKAYTAMAYRVMAYIVKALYRGPMPVTIDLRACVCVGAHAQAAEVGGRVYTPVYTCAHLCLPTCQCHMSTVFALACIVMACIVMAYRLRLGLCSYGLYSYGLPSSPWPV